MNYEQKYKEALEKARQFSERPLEEDSSSIVEYIFPELKESEDEKIRKAVIEMIHDTPNIECEENYNVRKEDALAWLEKQGEPLSVDVDVESMVQSYKKRLANECNISAESLLVTICLTSFRHGIENTIDDLKLKYLKTRQD